MVAWRVYSLTNQDVTDLSAMYLAELSVGSNVAKNSKTQNAASASRSSVEIIGSTDPNSTFG